MRIIFALLILQSCSSINCFSIDGKAYSRCIGNKRFTKLCEKHSGLDYHLGNVKGVCKDGEIFE